jgi:hypothetical protein
MPLSRGCDTKTNDDGVNAAINLRDLPLTESIQRRADPK